MPIIQCKFGVSDKVKVDQNHAGLVTCIEVRPGNAVRYEVSWFDASGVAQFVMFDEWRMELDK